MLIVLAETGWTPTMVGTGIIATVLLVGKIIPWVKSRNGNGNGTASAARDGEARGEMRAKIDAHAEELKRQDRTDEDQWTAINVTRDRLTKIETNTEQTQSDVSEIKTDLKSVLKGRGGSDE